jgi:hypothetical protein
VMRKELCETTKMLRLAGRFSMKFL